MTDVDRVIKPLLGGNMNKPPNKPPIAIGFADGDKSPKKDQWLQKKIQLCDREFKYWESKLGSSIFVETNDLDNLNLSPLAVVQKLLPS